MTDAALRTVGRSGRLVGGPWYADYREILLPLGPIPLRREFEEMAVSPNGYRQRHARWISYQMEAGWDQQGGPHIPSAGGIDHLLWLGGSHRGRS